MSPDEQAVELQMVEVEGLLATEPAAILETYSPEQCEILLPVIDRLAHFEEHVMVIEDREARLIKMADEMPVLIERFVEARSRHDAQVNRLIYRIEMSLYQRIHGDEPLAEAA